MKKIIYCLLLLFFVIISQAQTAINVYPTHWWTGMKNKSLQLMLHQKDVGKLDISMAAYPGVRMEAVTKVENPNYLFINLVIDETAQPGSLGFTATDAKTKKQQTVFTFQLKARRQGNGTAFAQGITSSDFIYFLMPDRFSNGDPSNDKLPGMRDQSLDRDSIFHRHGGDLQGIINHLDYLQSLGVTTLWMTPVLENDMPNRTEHGYAFTDHYKIEPRFGGDAAYKKLSDALHQRGMKLIQDAVYNHVGSFHFTFLDQPMKDWYHQWPSFTQTSYKDQPLMDPYAAKSDIKRTADGWFTTQMPDLNQSNPFVATFLIQHAIWCIEEFGVDGWRIDTYIYNDLAFMNRCNDALTDEYPDMTMFGEAWVHGTVNQAFFAQNTMNVPFKSNLQAPVDFQCNLYGIVPALTQQFGWTEGVSKLYTTLSNDFLYTNPMRNVIFLDNHDMSRFFSQVGEDVAKQKMGLAWLFTCRGIPQLYYGTEIMMKGFANPDGWVRLDFPGGWPGDQKNVFTGEGLTENEASVLNLTKKLGNFRKNSSAIKTGRFMQYLPVEGLYVYFRYDDKQTVMCVMNTSDKAQEVTLGNYAERTAGFSKSLDVVTGQDHGASFSIPAKQMWVLELK
ncbi:glycoside hydrolase family 13 protein [Foetidibacter luteolus]|uniref:glycoside hydrolase family 13 protein n=1 Tax=Foetidibacter luteolus TaxID=2608880 RepID=UPI00129B36BA|nr:glycoside hydrolase family 13 protein [Foetidibacter luteolus]